MFGTVQIKDLINLDLMKKYDELSKKYIKEQIDKKFWIGTTEEYEANKDEVKVGTIVILTDDSIQFTSVANNSLSNDDLGSLFGSNDNNEDEGNEESPDVEDLFGEGGTL